MSVKYDPARNTSSTTLAGTSSADLASRRTSMQKLSSSTPKNLAEGPGNYNHRQHCSADTAVKLPTKPLPGKPQAKRPTRAGQRRPPSAPITPSTFAASLRGNASTIRSPTRRPLSAGALDVPSPSSFGSSGGRSPFLGAPRSPLTDALFSPYKPLGPEDLSTQLFRDALASARSEASPHNSLPAWSVGSPSAPPTRPSSAAGPYAALAETLSKAAVYGEVAARQSLSKPALGSLPSSPLPRSAFGAASVRSGGSAAMASPFEVYDPAESAVERSGEISRSTGRVLDTSNHVTDIVSSTIERLSRMRSRLLGADYQSQVDSAFAYTAAPDTMPARRPRSHSLDTASPIAISRVYEDALRYPALTDEGVRAAERLLQRHAQGRAAIALAEVASRGPIESYWRAINVASAFTVKPGSSSARRVETFRSGPESARLAAMGLDTEQLSASIMDQFHSARHKAYAASLPSRIPNLAVRHSAELAYAQVLQAQDNQLASIALVDGKHRAVLASEVDHRSEVLAEEITARGELKSLFLKSFMDIVDYERATATESQVGSVAHRPTSAGSVVDPSSARVRLTLVDCELFGQHLPSGIQTVSVSTVPLVQEDSNAVLFRSTTTPVSGMCFRADGAPSVRAVWSEENEIVGNLRNPGITFDLLSRDVQQSLRYGFLLHYGTSVVPGVIESGKGTLALRHADWINGTGLRILPISVYGKNPRGDGATWLPLGTLRVCISVPPSEMPLMRSIAAEGARSSYSPSPLSNPMSVPQSSPGHQYAPSNVPQSSPGHQYAPSNVPQSSPGYQSAPSDGVLLGSQNSHLKTVSGLHPGDDIEVIISKAIANANAVLSRPVPAPVDTFKLDVAPSPVIPSGSLSSTTGASPSVESAIPRFSYSRPSSSASVRRSPLSVRISEDLATHEPTFAKVFSQYDEITSAERIVSSLTNVSPYLSLAPPAPSPAVPTIVGTSVSEKALPPPPPMPPAYTDTEPRMTATYSAEPATVTKSTGGDETPERRRGRQSSDGVDEEATATYSAEPATVTKSTGGEETPERRRGRQSSDGVDEEATATYSAEPATVTKSTGGEETTSRRRRRASNASE